MLALLVVLLTVLDRIGALQNTWRLHCDESQTVAHLNLTPIKDSKFTKISIKCEDEDGDFKNGNEIMIEIQGKHLTLFNAVSTVHTSLHYRAYNKLQQRNANQHMYKNML